MDEQLLGWVTIGSAVITVIGTGVTLYQARKVEGYSEKIAYDLRKISTSEIVDNLKRAQDECRKLLANAQQLNRGKSHAKITENIQRHFDYALNLLPVGGPDIDFRNMIVASQDQLRLFQNANSQAQGQFASDLHTKIQEAISTGQQRFRDLEWGGTK